MVDQWCLSAAAPAGTAPVIGSAYWSLVALGSPVDTNMVTDTVNGLGKLSAALGTLVTNIAAAKAAGQLAQKQAAAINVVLGNVKVSNFPITLPTS